MICLSKTDEAFARHLAWNQAPSPLAPQLTTRQDLNGLANLREHVDADQDDGSTGCALATSHEKSHLALQPCGPPAAPHAGWSPGAGPSSQSAAGLLPRDCPWGPARFWSWAIWLLSVLVTASLLSWVSSPPPRRSLAPRPRPRPVARKRATCASNSVDQDVYNLGLHVGALFVVLFASTLACAFPVLARKIPGLRIPRRFFFAVRHFGTGVLIATAFVHLLPTAFISLGDPCLAGFWTDDYPAIPGAIALAAIFFVVVVEMVFHPCRHLPEAPTTAAPLVTDQRALHGRNSSIAQGLSRIETADVSATPEGETAKAPPLTPEQLQRKQLLQCVLLELGILFHSVFIGMALSVSIGSDFIVLLIAIVFHQTFEGLALGARIAAVKWPRRRVQPWLMALAYGCTTPVGQAIGLATHTLYSPNSEIGLIVVGVMNAISAGLLTFASLVELLSEDFLSDESWHHLRGTRRVVACLLVFLGAFFMSLVGAWA